MKMSVKSAAGGTTEVPVGFIFKYFWDSKFLTDNCSKCPHCIPKEEAIVVLQAVALNNKGRWSPPAEESVAGICNWGKCPKTLVFRDKGPRKCDYFGKPRP